VEAAEDPATNGRTAIQQAAAIEALPRQARIPITPARLLHVSAPQLWRDGAERRRRVLRALARFAPDGRAATDGRIAARPRWPPPRRERGSDQRDPRTGRIQRPRAHSQRSSKARRHRRSTARPLPAAAPGRAASRRARYEFRSGEFFIARKGGDPGPASSDIRLHEHRKAHVDRRLDHSRLRIDDPRERWQTPSEAKSAHCAAFESSSR
jgi:hypothetical protein